ncbi:MAG TPA: lytic transglycosylase domain-containing protein [Pyrinomonadaceae bacterium]|nr:lytic transglycosylase domain-containing protein [Pyrinomonadaceae bacterium]
MKKFPLIVAFIWLFAAASYAQTGTQYRFDNFDFKDGVRVASVEAPQELAPQGKSLTTKTSGRGGINGRTSTLGYTRERMPIVMSPNKSLDGFTTGDPRVDSYIVESGTRYGIDPVLIYALMHQESSFKRGAISPKGARGLMQLMPATAARFGVTNIFDPRQNIEGGTRYLRFLLDAFDGDIALMLAGYNAGEGAVLKYGRRIPPYRETQEYVRRITQRYALMRDPETARRARTATPAEVAVAQSQPQVPLNIYERNVFAVRLPDGRLQLVSQ